MRMQQSEQDAARQDPGRRSARSPSRTCTACCASRPRSAIYDVFAWPEGDVPLPRRAAARRRPWCRSRSTSPRWCSRGCSGSTSGAGSARSSRHAHCVPVVVGAVRRVGDDRRRAARSWRWSTTTAPSTRSAARPIPPSSTSAGCCSARSWPERLKIVKPRTARPSPSPRRPPPPAPTPTISGEALAEAARQLLEKRRARRRAPPPARRARARARQLAQSPPQAEKIEDRLRARAREVRHRSSTSVPRPRRARWKS